MKGQGRKENAALGLVERKALRTPSSLFVILTKTQHLNNAALELISWV